jgi:5-methylcytosine-specific restriction endonuclease McrA
MQPCLVCGNKIESSNRTTKYCSANCRNKAWKLANREKYLELSRDYSKRKYRQDNPISKDFKRDCDMCGEAYIVYASHPLMKFCSRFCSRKNYRQENREKVNAAKRDSNSRHKDHLSSYNSLYKDQLRFSGNRLRALQRDNFTCQNCGYIGPQQTDNRSEDVVVHHIDFSGQAKKPNNKIENLQTLCRPCHIRLHTHKL